MLYTNKKTKKAKKTNIVIEPANKIADNTIKEIENDDEKVKESKTDAIVFAILSTIIIIFAITHAKLVEDIMSNIIIKLMILTFNYPVQSIIVLIFSSAVILALTKYLDNKFSC